MIPDVIAIPLIIIGLAGIVHMLEIHWKNKK